MKPLRILLPTVLTMSALTMSAADCFAAKPRFSTTAKKPTKIDESPEALPSFDAVTRLVQKQLASDPDYQSGDLVTSSTADRILLKLEQVNWQVADRRDILRMMLSDSDWLARQFTTRDGRQFMRQVASLPEGYDRVDRMRHMAYGESQLVDMMQSPDGFKMIEYMTTTPEGKNLGRMLSEDPGGRNFNKGTGKIYTELDLLKRLKKSYDAEATRRLAHQPPGTTAPGEVMIERDQKSTFGRSSKQTASKQSKTWKTKKTRSKFSKSKRSQTEPAPAKPAETVPPKAPQPEPQKPISNDPFENLPRSR